MALSKDIRNVHLLDGNPNVLQYVLEKVELCQPSSVHVCDGSDAEYGELISRLLTAGVIRVIPKHPGCYLTRTNPEDVARVESKTFICTEDRREAVVVPREGVKSQLGNWVEVGEMDRLMKAKFEGCMKGRVMYVVPFCMGPIGSSLSKIGLEITDSAYVAVSMRVMTRMGADVLKQLSGGEFVRCLHSVGQPLPLTEPDPYNWPCNPKETAIAHFPRRREVMSFGSGYGGNSLLGKKCFALRIASVLARDEMWLAEHMLIMAVTNPEGVKKYICAAFPSACGKTNLAMMTPTLPGWRVEVVGDDIAWMKFDSQGHLRAINPESGFFGVCPGTTSKTNPIAMASIFKDTIFTNVAETSDGDVFWEGLESEMDLAGVSVTNWLKEENWTRSSTSQAAHPNSRFCAPIVNCPILDEHWDDPEGVPISAIIFGGRRPSGVPLVMESFSWEHGVLLGAGVKSEATAAAEFKGKTVMHDPFAMRPFFGYNFGHYLEHWLSMGRYSGAKLPKIFHVNWFLRDERNAFLWPGFGENSRVIKWIFDRCDNAVSAVDSPIGRLPRACDVDVTGLNGVDVDRLLAVSKAFWLSECEELRQYLNDNVHEDLPQEIVRQLDALQERLEQMA